MPDYKLVNFEQLNPGPILIESLPVELYNRAKRIYELTYEVQYITFEEFETNFRRDINPESEIRVWEMIASAYIKFIEFKSFVKYFQSCFGFWFRESKFIKNDHT